MLVALLLDIWLRRLERPEAFGGPLVSRYFEPIIWQVSTTKQYASSTTAIAHAILREPFAGLRQDCKDKMTGHHVADISMHLSTIGVA